MIFNLNKQAGFSLVETLVSISILLLVIVGPMTITSRTAKSATFASEQVQAFFLAQEGVELAQKARSDLVLRKFLPTVHANYLALILPQVSMKIVTIHQGVVWNGIRQVML